MELPVIVLHPTAAFRDGIAQALDRRRFKYVHLVSDGDLPELFDRGVPAVAIVCVDRKVLWDRLAHLGALHWATVIALVSAADPAAHVRALRLGADGVVEASSPVARILAVMESALGGDFLLTQAAARQILEGARFAFEVSERDIRILQALADNETMLGIARTEHVSYSTARRLVQDLPNRFGVNHIQVAISKASALGLIEVGIDRCAGSGDPERSDLEHRLSGPRESP